jgi:hypothetical protein
MCPLVDRVLALHIVNNGELVSKLFMETSAYFLYQRVATLATVCSGESVILCIIYNDY